MLTLPKIIADFEVSLAASVSVGQTTATLSSVTDKDGNTIPNGLYCFTIDRGSSSKKEHIIATLTGTALSSISSVSRQGTTTSGFVRSHRLGANVIISDYAALKRILDNVDGTTGFNSSVKLGYDADPSITSGDLTKFATVKFVNDTSIAGAPDATTVTKGVTRLSTAPVSATAPIAVGDNDTRVPTQAENDALAGTNGTPSGANPFVTNSDTSGTGSVVRSSLLSSVPKFGGTGSNGALSISSGTTTVDLGGAAYFVLNYTSIDITGTASLAFSNPNANGTIVVIKSQGNVTITSSATPAIDLRNLGGIGGNGGASATNANGNNGASGSSYNSPMDTIAHSGTGGSGGIDNTAGVGGTGGAAVLFPNLFGTQRQNITLVNVGSGGGGGGSGRSSSGASGAGGAGGRGAGTLYLECRGTYSCSSIINASGTAGSAGSGNGASNAGTGGGGGGGGGGDIYVLYNALSSDTGTYTVSGGAGGVGGTVGTFFTAQGGSGGAGGAGGKTGGTNGVSVSTNVQTGGAGGAGSSGTSTIELNITFA